MIKRVSKDRKCICSIVQPRLPQSIYSYIKPLLTCKLHLVQNRPCELVRGAYSSHVAGPYLSVEKSVRGFEERIKYLLPFGNNIVDGLGDAVGMLVET